MTKGIQDRPVTNAMIAYLYFIGDIPKAWHSTRLSRSMSRNSMFKQIGREKVARQKC